MILPVIRFVFDRKHKAEKGVKGTVDMVLSYNRQRKFVSTGVKCYPHQWKEDVKRSVYVKGTGADMEINGLLQSLYQKAYRIVTEQVEKGEVEISAIPTLLKAQDVDMTFLDYITKRMDGKQVAHDTHRAHVSFYNKLCEFGRIKFFSDISEKSVRDFDEWLHAYTWKETDRFGREVTRTYSQASIGSYHKNLKAFINDAMVDGYVKENPYSSKRIKIDKGSTRIDKFLTKEEVERIEKAEMPTRSLAETRDLFLIQVFTGLSYGDLMAYDFTQCRNAEEYAVFSGYRKKTGVLFTFVLTPDAKKILKKYKFVLPKMPNQKYNVKIKLMTDAAGIDKSISSHDARRSCGYILLNAGVPIGVVQRVLGHSSLIQTQSAYARLLDKTISEEIKKHLK